MPNKTVANLVINAPEFGMNDSFEIEDTAARAAADAAASTAASTAATVQTMGTRLTAVETKNTQQDTAIANAVEAIGGKTQMYTTAGGVNTPYPQLRIGTGLSVDNGVLSATGGGGDISALTARVAALETNDGIQDTDIDNLQTAMTAAQGDIGALETNDGVQDTDIDDLQTRMGTAENDIDALEANDLRFSVEKTGLYTSSGGTNTYFTDLLLGTTLAVTNGTLDVVGGGGGGAGYDITATSDANSAATGWTYPATGATNFPVGVELGISTGTYAAPKTMLLTTDFDTGNTAHPDGKMQVCIYGTAIYTRQRSVDSNPSSATGYIWSDWVVSSYSTAKQTAYIDAIMESGLYKPTASTSLPTGAGTDGVLFAQMVLTPAEFIAANVGHLAQVQQYTTASGIWVRTGVVGGYNPFTQQYGIQFGNWTEIAGGGNALPDQTTYTTFGSGKRLYVTDTEPTGSDIPLGSVWIGGDA